MSKKTDKAIAKAEKLTTAGKFEQAAEEYKKVLEETPNDINTQKKIADLYARAGKIREAVNSYQVVAKHHGERGFHAKAIATYKIITKIDPKNNSAYRQLADLYNKEGLPNEAREALILVAQNFSEKGELQDAKEAYERILEMQPESIKVRIKLAEIYEKTKDTAKATTEFLEIGKALIEKNLDKEAQSVFEKAIKLDSTNLEAANNLADIYTRAGNNQGAINLYVRIINEQPENLDALKALGRTYYNINNIQKAYETIQRVLGMTPDEPELLELMAKISIQRDNVEDAHMFITRFIDLKFSGKASKEAADLLKMIIEKDPHHVKTLEKMLQIYTAISDMNGVVWTYEKLGLAYRHHNLLEKALEVYNKVIDFQPENKKAQIAIGELNKLMIESIPQSEETKQALGGDEDIVAVGPVDFGLDDGEVSAPVSDPTAPPQAAPMDDLAPKPKPVGAETPQPPQQAARVTVDSAPPPAPAADDFNTEEVYEIEILVKYGLLDKAQARLGALLDSHPENPEVRRLMRSIYLEQGDKVNWAMESVTYAGLLEKEKPDKAEEVRNEGLKVLQDLFEEGIQLPPEALSLIGEGATAAPPEPAPAPEPQPQAQPEPALDPASLQEVVEETPEPVVEATPAPAPEPEIELTSEEVTDTSDQMETSTEIVEDEEVISIQADPPAKPETDEIEEEIDDILVDSILPEDEPVEVTPAEPVVRSEIQIDDFAEVIQTEVPPQTAEPSPVEEAPVPEMVEEPLVVEDDLLEELTPVPTAPEPEPVPEPQAAEVPPVESAPPPEPVPEPPAVEEDPLAGLPPLTPAQPPDEPSPPAPPQQVTGDDISAMLSGDSGSAEVSDDELGEMFNTSVVIEDEKDLLFELEEVDFYLDQEFLEEARSKLTQLQEKFPSNEEVQKRLNTLAEKSAQSEIKQMHDDIDDLKGIFDEDPVSIEHSGDISDELEGFLSEPEEPKPEGKKRSLEPIEDTTRISVPGDLFKEEEDFFNITSEIEDEFDIPEPTTNVNLEAQLESVFDEFRDEVNEKLGGEDYETRYNLGVAYMEMDLVDEAIQEFQSAAKGEEHLVDASANLGLCFMKKEMATQAIQWFTKALKALPADAERDKALGLRLELAKAFLLNNQKDHASALIQQISQVDPDYPQLAEVMKYL